MSKHKYDDEFRKQIVDLIDSKVKIAKEISGEYSLPVQTIHTWVRKYKSTPSFRDENQLTPKQKEIRGLKKKIKQIEE
ncbi:MAG: transposase [Fusobacteriaceae bacterium]